MVDEDVATEAPLHGMAGTFDRDEPPPRTGEPVPPGWHLAYFPDAAKRRDPADDGLPSGRGVLPIMPLPRRMSAGATLTFHTPILVGDKLRREIEFSDTQVRQGSTGTLILLTQTRRIYTPRGLALTDAQHGVFREAVPTGAQSGIPRRGSPPAALPWRRIWAPDSVTLFRYPALAFNPHRIHHDRPYAIAVEGYPGLVVHGPFSRQCLLDLLRDSLPRTIVRFDMRARAPLFDTATFAVVGRPVGDDEAELWTAAPDGTIAMQVKATLQ